MWQCTVNETRRRSQTTSPMTQTVRSCLVIIADSAARQLNHWIKQYKRSPVQIWTKGRTMPCWPSASQSCRSFSLSFSSYFPFSFVSISVDADDKRSPGVAGWHRDLYYLWPTTMTVHRTGCPRHPFQLFVQNAPMTSAARMQPVSVYVYTL